MKLAGDMSAITTPMEITQTQDDTGTLLRARRGAGAAGRGRRVALIAPALR